MQVNFAHLLPACKGVFHILDSSEARNSPVKLAGQVQ